MPRRASRCSCSSSASRPSRTIPDDPGLARLDRLGFNHVCFAVDDLAAEVARLEAAGVRRRNAIMEFHDRKLVFLAGPEGVAIELSERH